MTPKEIEAAIREHLNDSWDTTDIAWPNRSYTPTTGTAWVRLSILPGQGFVDEIGNTTAAAGHRNGVVKIGVFVPLDSGSMTASDYAGQIEAIFRRADVDGVYFDEPYSTVNGSDGSWYQITCNCPFWAWK